MQLAFAESLRSSSRNCHNWICPDPAEEEREGNGMNSLATENDKAFRGISIYVYSNATGGPWWPLVQIMIAGGMSCGE